MKHALLAVFAFSLFLICPSAPARAADADGVLRVKPTDDFEVTGDGKNAAWAKTEWEAIPQRTKDGATHETKMKVLYSRRGIYVLFDAADKTLTTTGRGDFEKLWEEDVLEIFFWTDEKQPLYFEYEISPLGFELPILVPNNEGKFLGWRPWMYEGNRKIKKATAVSGGKKEAGATVTGWTAEIFIPYELLNPLGNVPPRAGTQWRANFYRMDYDGGKQTRWTWVPVGQSFHEYQKFGKMVFELLRDRPVCDFEGDDRGAVMDLKNDLQLTTTREKLKLLEEHLSRSRAETDADPHLRELSERSLNRHIKRLKKEILRYEAHRREEVSRH